MPPYLDNIKEFLGRLSLGQKLALGLVIFGGIGVLTGIAYWANKPDYTLLFGSLAPTDANKVVEVLQSDGIRYQLKENGTAIYVPRDQVYELRLRFAGEGVISDGLIGYELFDKGTLGMTDFMQKLNLRRALEGELARTISNIKQVAACRVHLVMPERSPFRETQTRPSASVILELAGNARLTSEQIEGITALVAGAVEGLSPTDVTVLDSRGNMLSNPDANDADALISSTQLKHQRAIEVMLTEKGQSILDQIVGRGNAVVRVNATLDFDRSVAERNVIDPESATVIAEERHDEQGGTDVANSSIRNYELTRTLERTEKGVGTIRYLTVSVLLNARPAQRSDSEEEDETQPAFETYPPEELAEIEALVKNAVGYNAERGDQFAIHQTRFDTSVDDQIATEIREQRRMEQFQLYLRYGLMVLALALAAWLIRSASRRLTAQGHLPAVGGPLQAHTIGGDGQVAQLEGGAAGGPPQLGAHPDEDEDDLVLVDDVYTSKLSPEARARLKAKHIMFEEIKKQVNDKPEAAADLIRSWLVADMNEN